MKGKRQKRLKGRTKCVTSSTFGKFILNYCVAKRSFTVPRKGNDNKLPLIKELWYVIHRTNDRHASLMYF
jgi:hypothetical protein